MHSLSNTMQKPPAKHAAPRRPVLLIIMDGVGVNPGKQYNAVYTANTPRLDAYFAHFPHTTLHASGTAVGVPDGQMGNSEVGHMTLGSGCIIRQDMVRINDAIENGEFFSNPAFLAALQTAKQKQRPLHLLGLVSDGGVHSSLDHLRALLRLCKQHSVKPLLHAITDGRDTSPKSALNYFREIEPLLYDCGGGMATISGRYYAMDRDKRWERIELAWRAIMLGKGQRAHSAETLLRTAYSAGDSDEFIRPAILPNWQAPQAGDPLISFNFRKDRPQQIVAALGDPNFHAFDRGDTPLFDITCMMPYNQTLNMPYAFSPERPPVTLGEIISQHGLQQFHCAETEKYAHVTYFFNGGRHEPYSGETQYLVPSPKVATYDMQPQMSAPQIADAVIDAMSKNKYAFIVVNFANGDMVGHTASFDAVVAAVEALDHQVGRLLDAAQMHDYSAIVTADHGNCEELFDPYTQELHTQHTLYPVPCLIMDKENWQLSCQGGLSNIAPTVLQLLGIDQPAAMRGKSLLLKPLPPLPVNQAWKGAA